MSLDDPRLAPFRDLRARDDTRFVAEGEIAVRRALESRFLVETVVATPSVAARLRPLVGDASALVELGAAELRELVGFEFHRGCLASVRRPPAGVALPPLARGLVVVLERLADPVNVGAIARTTRALGGAGLVVDPSGADPFSRRAIRASMANVFHLPVEVPPHLVARVEQLRGMGFRVLAASVGPRATPIAELRRPAGDDRVALCLGHEGDGLSPALLGLAHEEVTIPVAPDSDSLNVAAAAAILIHSLRA